MAQNKPAVTTATREEIDAAVAALTETDLVRLRKFADARIVRIGAAADGRNHEVLLSEAYRRVLSTRSWVKKIPFVDHLFGTIRSISSHWAEEFKRELKAGRRFISEDHDARTDDGSAHTVASGTPDAEREIIARDLLKYVKELFTGDQLALDIIAGWEEEFEGPEIREIVGVDRNVFDAKVRAIRRRLIDEGLKTASKKGTTS